MDVRLESVGGVICGALTGIGNVTLRNHLFHAIKNPSEKWFEALVHRFPSREHIPMLAGFVRSVNIDPQSVAIDDDSITFRTTPPA